MLAGGEQGENPEGSSTTRGPATSKKKSGAQKRKKQRERLRLSGPGGNSRANSGPGSGPTSGESLKRPRSTGSTPPEQRQTQKRANNHADGPAKDAMVVAIVGRDFPETLLGDTQVRALEEAMMLHVVKQNANYVPQFEARRLVDGALHVTCRSGADYWWLKNNVGHLKPWDGADLVVKTVDQLPKKTKVMVYTRTGQTARDILEALRTFNKGLSADSWRVLDFKKGDQQKENSLLVSVTDKDLRELRRLGMRPCYGLGRAKCHVVGGGGAGSGSKEGTALQQPKRGPETSNMEVDNPATTKEKSTTEVADEHQSP